MTNAAECASPATYSATTKAWWYITVSRAVRNKVERTARCYPEHGVSTHDARERCWGAENKSARTHQDQLPRHRRRLLRGKLEPESHDDEQVGDVFFFGARCAVRLARVKPL